MRHDDGVEHDDVPLAPASEQDGTYPRPQLVRPAWADLCGPWSFAFDDDDRGLAECWFRAPAFERTITVPFPFESAASGIGDTGFHRVAWYSRALTAADLQRAGHSQRAPRLVLHFGAVDYRATVWIDGVQVGQHEGGHTPFSFEVQHALREGEGHEVVVRVEDDPADVGQPRGKQDWRRDAHSIWYDRTSGIWQPVWLEATPAVAVAALQWRPDVVRAVVEVEVRTTTAPAAGTRCRVQVAHDGEALGWSEFPLQGPRATATVALPVQGNGQAYEELLWTPEHPTLLDATVELIGPEGAGDRVASYLGLASARVEGGVFLLNDRPRFLRAVLEQGFWPESHLAAPSAKALEDEVRLILDLGFDTARLHQKMEDPRFLFWADRLGLLVWCEAPGTYEFSPTAVVRSTAEWVAAVERDRSHPCVAAWVPLNESWGVQHIAHDPAQRAYARALADLTRALDPGRPVISNDGWEHVDSDVLSIHDYEADPAVLAGRYGPAASRDRLLNEVGPAGRRILVGDERDRGQPVMLTEFGGVRYDVRAGAPEGWGYSTVTAPAEFEQCLRGMFDAVRPGGVLTGVCWTQLTDTMQEANGLTDEHRVPKLDPAVIREIVTGPARS